LAFSANGGETKSATLVSLSYASRSGSDFVESGCDSSASTLTPCRRSDSISKVRANAAGSGTS
jgi:hypothetical protein